MRKMQGTDNQCFALDLWKNISHFFPTWEKFF